MDLAEPTARNRLYALVAETVRRTPAVRGKIRIAQKLYQLCNRDELPFHVKASLYGNSLAFHLNLNCGHERAALLMDGYEPETTAFLSSIYRGGDILDVGANIGLIGLPLGKRLAAAGGEGRIFAIEPMPANFTTLCANIRENALVDRVIPLDVAVGDADRADLRIQVEGDDFAETGTANILADARCGTKFHAGDFRMSGQVKMAIVARTLDSLVAEGAIAADIGLIKIDADGYDFKVLKGASKLLTTARPIIFSEMSAYCLGWHGETIADVIAFAREHRYRVWAKEPRRFRFSDRFDPETFEMEALLVPDERRGDYEAWLAAPR